MPYADPLPSGRYRAAYRDATGKKRYVPGETFTNKKAALAAATRAEEDARLPGWRDPRSAARTWGEWETEWMAMHEVAAATTKNELSFLKNHIRPRWEKERLADITKGDVLAWAKQLGTPKEQGGAGLKASSVARVVATFRTSLQAAIDKEVLQYNPATRLKLPKPAQADPKFLTREEADRLLEALDARHRFIVDFLLGTGLRFGEAAGLRPSRVSLDGARITVREAWSSTTGLLSPVPKGKTERTVPVPPHLREELLWLVKMAEADMVFFPRLHSSNFRQRVWNPAVKAAGIPEATPHSTRHTYGSWLLQGGVPIAEIARLMGHTDEEITRMYARLADFAEDDIFAALGGGGGRMGQNVGQVDAR
ncbi:tyrosine-type recombinase/integrase [Pseudolysinimonas sp.]|uniref:tyrosine-type recombinase/integrase n=1 Tax=Pseudolysinimonas sp. TaxID=2680009 RepID=UPI003F7D6000